MCTSGEAAEHATKPTDRSQRPTSAAFREFIANGWDVVPARGERAPVAPYAEARRGRISARYHGERLVVPAGGLKQRSNDTDYRFRPHSAFVHLTGFGTDREPDAVLVLHPAADPADGHEPVLYFRPRAPRDSQEFYADTRYGELWVGPRPTLEAVEAELGITCRHRDQLADELRKDADAPGGITVRIVPDVAADVSDTVADIAQAQGVNAETLEQRNIELARDLSELRLVKDDYEVDRIRESVDLTLAGFDEVVRALPRAMAHRRGERVIETAFDSLARVEGNGTGYDTIAAAGDHACTLHWIRNDGPVRPGDLMLVDAGVEHDSLYTADLTRTLPVDGQFTEDQARVYQAVLDAADAAFAVARPGARFRDIHEAAMGVIADRLHSWGLLPVSVEASLDPEHGGQHRRWMVHGTSHHLGLDVHDCAQARREMYLDGVLEPGMVFTIEPGLYFKADDELVPPQMRGIGVRIEDNVLVTATGNENLSARLPRTISEVERWMTQLKEAR